MEQYQSQHNIIAGDHLPSGTFSVHSGFDDVINFRNEMDQMVFVTSRRDLLSPNTIFIGGIRLDAIETVTITPDVIQLGDKKFKRRWIDIYCSAINLEAIDLSLFESNLIRIPSRFLPLFPEKSLVFLLNPINEKCFNSGFDKQFMINAKKCSGYLLSGEIVSGIKIIRGTGYGLTPSGDDFIAGLLLGIHFNEFRSGKDMSHLKEIIYRSAIGSNLLTNSFLLNAKRGKYFSPLKKVLLLLGDESQSMIKEALIELFAVGATSGADLFSGYIFSVKYRVGL